MATKWVSVITDEAMQKICYEGGGWQLSPYRFAISETDYLQGMSVVEPSGIISDDAYKKLTSITTAAMQEDISTTSNVWCISPFSSITKSADNSLLHHIVIPPDLADVITNKNIKTIYFQYQANNEEVFLYAIAHAVEDILYESGVTQSFYFNFTVSNRLYMGNTDFVVNYTYPQEISDHNTTEDVHDCLVKRDGSREITNILSYASINKFTKSNELVSKSYVDSLIKSLVAANPNLKLPSDFS